ncbi:MAG: hypothetical protein AABZ31_12615 [Bdellovibrionota bacterium]
MRSVTLFLSLFFSFLTAQAQVAQPMIEFSPTEISEHKSKIQLIIDTAAQCLDRTYADHTDFYDKYGFSKYFGNRNAIYQTRAQRFTAVRALPQVKGMNDQQVSTLVDQMRPTACITLAVQCLGKGFKEAGNEATWNKIFSHLNNRDPDHKFLGTDLVVDLQKLGWKIYYWNPDPSSNAKWDEEDRRLNPLKPGKSWNAVWGGHAPHFNNVIKRGTYMGIKVDDAKALVNFNRTQPSFFKQIPFFVGVAHAGYHVFPGYNGGVIEAHSKRKISARDNLEVSEFNPLGTSGGPRWTNIEKYRSGIMAIPPGY